MDINIANIVAAHIRSLQPYVPGKPISELYKELGIKHIIKLASNENPLGPSSQVIAGCQQAIADAHYYPDSQATSLRNKLCQLHNIDKAQLFIANGSDSIFSLLASIFIQPGKEAIISEHSFASYRIAIAKANGICRTVAMKNWQHDLSLMLATITDATQLIFIANPDNPTGARISEDKLTAFLTEVPKNIPVVLDQAYYEYMCRSDYPNGIMLQQRFPNLIVTRTFSKIYGLAGLRIGYSIASPDVTELLYRVRPPFDVNQLALLAAEIAIDDQTHLQESLTVNEEGKKQLTQALDQLTLQYLPVNGNFITVNFQQNTQQIYQQLLQQGIIVRPLINYGMPTFLRISIGLAQDNMQLVNAIARVLSL